MNVLKINNVRDILYILNIEFATGLWTRISYHLEKNHTKIAVSRNEPFSGHYFSFSNTRKSYITTPTSVFTAFIIDTCPLSINKSFLKSYYFPFIFTLLYDIVK